jgi:hypothetical protein
MKLAYHLLYDTCIEVIFFSIINCVPSEVLGELLQWFTMYMIYIRYAVQTPRQQAGIIR